MRSHRKQIGIRWLMTGVAFVALAIAWASRWSEYRYRAAFHAGVAADHRWFAKVPSTELARRRHRDKAEWHETMRRRLELASWFPWPFGPTQPPWPFDGDGPRMSR
ncbi:hypothetical protein P12x_005727 [Tundrisphaera lichenicola]|uniref:hypothetical protein n=1 Tax=Tundrisphaera lichenicola TaxID=2029860 RepID=UPI003EB78723